MDLTKTLISQIRATCDLWEAASANRNLDGSTQQPVVQLATEANDSRTAPVQSAQPVEVFRDWIAARVNQLIADYKSHPRVSVYEEGRIAFAREVAAMFENTFDKKTTAKSMEAWRFSTVSTELLITTPNAQ